MLTIQLDVRPGSPSGVSGGKKKISAGFPADGPDDPALIYTFEYFDWMVGESLDVWQLLVNSSACNGVPLLEAMRPPVERRDRSHSVGR